METVAGAKDREVVLIHGQDTLHSHPLDHRNDGTIHEVHFAISKLFQQERYPLKIRSV